MVTLGTSKVQALLSTLQIVLLTMISDDGLENAEQTSKNTIQSETQHNKLLRGDKFR